MPKAVDAKTKSGHKTPHETPASGFLPVPGGGVKPPARTALPRAAKRKKIILYSMGVVLALGLLLAGSILYTPAQAHLQVGGKTILLDIAQTTAQQQQGLSGRKNMANNRGMLFIFSQSGATCFWMKGMEFPLDMVWLNGAKQVVYLQQSVSPKSYPKQFCPSTPAKYVIELNAGQAKALDITLGKTLNI